MCGIFGMIDYGSKLGALKRESTFTALAKANEQRGTSAGGVAYFDRSKEALVVIRREGAITKTGVLDHKGLFDHRNVFMGHTRQTTHGSANNNINNHPFPSEKGTYAMAHNGVIGNYDALGISEGLKRTDVETDSYVVNQLLDEKHNGVINMETLKDVGELLSGSFNLTFIDTNQDIWLVKHNNPLTIMDVTSHDVLFYTSDDKHLIPTLEDLTGSKDLFTDLLTGRVDVKVTLTDPVSGDIFKLSHEDGSVVERGTFKPKAYNPYKSWEDYAYGYDACSRGRATTYVPKTQVAKNVTKYYYHNEEEVAQAEEAFITGKSVLALVERDGAYELADIIKGKHGKERYYSKVARKSVHINNKTIKVLEYFDKYPGDWGYSAVMTSDLNRLTNTLGLKNTDKEILSAYMEDNRGFEWANVINKIIEPSRTLYKGKNIDVRVKNLLTHALLVIGYFSESKDDFKTTMSSLGIYYSTTVANTVARVRALAFLLLINGGYLYLNEKTKVSTGSLATIKGDYEALDEDAYYRSLLEKEIELISESVKKRISYHELYALVEEGYTAQDINALYMSKLN